MREIDAMISDKRRDQKALFQVLLSYYEWFYEMNV